jgi:hypothetical protein
VRLVLTEPLDGPALRELDGVLALVEDAVGLGNLALPDVIELAAS